MDQRWHVVQWYIRQAIYWNRQRGEDACKKALWNYSRALEALSGL